MTSAERALCSGKTLAFQANDAGSIPAARSKHFPNTIHAKNSDLAAHVGYGAAGQISQR